jgi:hypothetical protein
MRTRFALLPLLLLGLGACASAPDPRFRDPSLAEWNAAEFGDEPGNYDAAIRSYMESLLQDPRGATLTVRGGPTKTWVGTAPDFQYGFGVCVEIVERGVYSNNANFGQTFFLLVNGRVAQMREGSDGERLCSRLGRMPDSIKDP